MFSYRRYDSCFLKWYSESTKVHLICNDSLSDLLSEYLRGTAKGDECEPLFKEYKACLSVSPATRDFEVYVLTLPQKALKDRGIDQMLDDARMDNKENDLEYLKPSIISRCKHVLCSPGMLC